MTERRRAIRALGLLGALAAVVAAGVWVSGQDPGVGTQPTDPEVASKLWPEPLPIRAFELVDHQGEPFTNERFHGQWTFLFFGYTHCPDVCPMTLEALAQVRKILDEGGDAGDTGFVFVTLDAERDTVEALDGYVGHFDEDFVGVTGDQEEIDALAEQLGVMNVRVSRDGGADAYHIDHTTSVMLVDPEGRVRAAFPNAHAPQRVARQYREISAL